MSSPLSEKAIFKSRGRMFVRHHKGRPSFHRSPVRASRVVLMVRPETSVQFKRIHRPVVALLVCFALASGGCFEGERGEQFYGKADVPRAQEFRWSDGGLPKIFDPALAAAAPDTDAVRAMFEGLTDYDPRQLKPVSAVAVRWESSPDNRRWTFHLRKNARWSNGDAVTAHDFVRSWRRTLRFGRRAPHVKLMENIDGARAL